MIPDWLQLVVGVASLLIGVWVAWYFFREQERTDFKRLELNLIQHLTKLAESVERVDAKVAISSQIDLARDLSAMREAVEALRQDMRHLNDRILNDVREKQGQVMLSVDRNFRVQVEASRTTILQALKTETGSSVAPELRERTLERLRELYEHAIRSMGEYQRRSIDEAFADGLSELSESLRDEVGRVTARVEELNQLVESLPRALPPG